MAITERYRPVSPETPPAVGPQLRRLQRLGRYTLMIPLGRGGMADVWMAAHQNDLGFRKLVAIKAIRPEHANNPAIRRMFLDEARVAARIRHSNVVEVMDLGEEAGLVYLVMSYVEGVSLSGLVAAVRAPLPLGASARIVIDALLGLHAAHELRGDDGTTLELVHRDVSPQNILVGADGVAKLTDFGIAKITDVSRVETETGELKGKVAYMAPEQLLAGRLASGPSRRSDLFSMGVVLWELMTGRALFASSSRIALVALRLEDAPARDPREIDPSLPAAMVEVVLRALRRDPHERYESALAMAEALEASARGILFAPREVGTLVGALAATELARVRSEVAAIRTQTGVREARADAAEGLSAPAPVESRPASAPSARGRGPLLKVGAGLFVAFVLGALASRLGARGPVATTAAPPTGPETSVPVEDTAAPAAPASSDRASAAPSPSDAPASRAKIPSVADRTSPRSEDPGSGRPLRGSVAAPAPPPPPAGPPPRRAPTAAGPAFQPPYASPYER